MSAIGYFMVRAYTSYAQIPLEDVAVAVTSPDGTVIALELSDSSGLTSPIEIPVPDRFESQEPDPPEKPYALVNLYAQLPGYEAIEAENIQIFANVTTYQDLEMVPLSDNPNESDWLTVYDTPPQNL